jgi:hypothetical protein
MTVKDAQMLGVKTRWKGRKPGQSFNGQFGIREQR